MFKYLKFQNPDWYFWQNWQTVNFAALQDFKLVVNFSSRQTEGQFYSGMISQLFNDAVYVFLTSWHSIVGRMGHGTPAVDICFLDAFTVYRAAFR